MAVKELLPNFWHVSNIDFLFVKNFIEKLPSASFKVLVYQKYLGPGSPLKSYNFTAWKVSVFGVILARIFPHSDWLRRDTEYLSVFSPNAGKYRPEKNSVYGHFSRSLNHLLWVTGVSLSVFHNHILLGGKSEESYIYKT